MTRSYEIASCPACGKTVQRVLADRDAIKQQVEDLWRFQLRRRRHPVPLEQLYDRAFFSQAPPLQLVECIECGTVYRNPRESERDLRETYAGEEPDTTVFEGLFEAQRVTYSRQAALLTGFAGKAGRGLELGSYVGAFLAAARAQGWAFEGVDINPTANRFAERRGFHICAGTLDDTPAGRAYHAIAIWNCFDQLPDPRATLHASASRLQPGGILAVRVPNGAFYARFNHRAPGPLARLLLAHNNLLAFPYRHGFTPDSLTRLIGDSGFDVLAVRGDTLVRTSDRWTRPWAAVEERVVKALLRGWPLRRLAPWFEVYARLR